MVNNRYNKGDERILLKTLKFTHRRVGTPIGILWYQLLQLTDIQIVIKTLINSYPPFKYWVLSK